MKIRQSIGRCLPSQIQFKREFADLAAQSKSGYVTLRKLWQCLYVAKGSSKPEAAHCQNRYPSPNEWSDHTRVRPLTPFQGSNGPECAGFAPKSPKSSKPTAVVWETIPCDTSAKVAHHVLSGAKTSGETICSTLSKFLAFWASWQLCRPVRAAVSNVRLSVPSAVRWPQPFWIPTWLAVRCLVVWPVLQATRLVFAPTKPLVALHLRADRASNPGGPFVFSRAA